MNLFQQVSRVHSFRVIFIRYRYYFIVVTNIRSTFISIEIGLALGHNQLVSYGNGNSLVFIRIKHQNHRVDWQASHTH